MAEGERSRGVCVVQQHLKRVAVDVFCVGVEVADTSLPLTNAPATCAVN